MKTVSRIISWLFHPLLFPTYGTLLILLLNPNMFGAFGERVHGVWLIIVFALTFMFPAVWILMMRKLEMIDSLAMETTRERIVPFISTATFYLWAAWMFKPNVHMKIPANQFIFLMMIGACFSVFVAFFLNIFMKISLHTLAAGSLLGLLLTIMPYSTYDLRAILFVAILFAGIVGVARLVLNVHSNREVFIGYFVGFSGQFVAFSIVSHLL